MLKRHGAIRRTDDVETSVLTRILCNRFVPSSFIYWMVHSFPSHIVAWHQHIPIPRGRAGRRLNLFCLVVLRLFNARMINLESSKVFASKIVITDRG